MIIGFVIREPFFIYLSQIANLLHLVWIIYITCPMPQNPSKLQIVSVPLIYKSCCFTLKKRRQIRENDRREFEKKMPDYWGLAQLRTIRKLEHINQTN